MLWKSRLSWKQYIPRKRSRFSLKSFALCDARTGYVWNSILYSGKDTDGIEDGNADYHATRIVCSLAKNLFNKGYCIYVDNWYTSVELCKVLKENGCDIIGTLRKDRKGLPISVVKAKMKTGQRKVSYEHKLRVMSLGWKDKRVVFLMGTCINDSLVTVKWRGFETVIPQIVNVYNNQMGGVDRSDQMLRSYEVERKRVKKWYKKQIMHLINVATFNSHILHKKKGGKLNPLEFRKRLVISLFEKYSNRSTTAAARRGQKSHENNPL